MYDSLTHGLKGGSGGKKEGQNQERKDSKETAADRIATIMVNNCVPKEDNSSK